MSVGWDALFLPASPNSLFFVFHHNQQKIHAILLIMLDADKIEIRIVDTTPIPVVKIWRAGKCRSFNRYIEVNYGYCASKKMYYYGS
jgi:hypothetical protein